MSWGRDWRRHRPTVENSASRAGWLWRTSPSGSPNKSTHAFFYLNFLNSKDFLFSQVHLCATISFSTQMYHNQHIPTVWFWIWGTFHLHSQSSTIPRRKDKQFGFFFSSQLSLISPTTTLTIRMVVYIMRCKIMLLTLKSFWSLDSPSSPLHEETPDAFFFCTSSIGGDWSLSNFKCYQTPNQK